MRLRYRWLIASAQTLRALKDLNPKAHHKCKYCGEEYRGIWSNHRLSHHQVKKHPIQLLVEVSATAMVAMMLLGFFVKIHKEAGE